MKPFLLVRHHDAKNLDCLARHLKEWICVLDDYLTKVKDSPFGYGERTQIGFFAAASWRLGIPALEEWRTEKGSQELVRGRGDLWLMQDDIHIEAKHAWRSIAVSQDRAKHQIQKLMGAAAESAKHLRCARSRKLAFTFVSPTIPIGRLKDIEPLMTDWLAGATQADHDAIAWFLPERTRTKRFDFPHLAIGEVLFINRVK
jgi:hypothetical protein